MGIPSMEGLDGIVGLAKLHGLECDAVSLNNWATRDEAKLFVDRKGIET